MLASPKSAEEGASDKLMSFLGHVNDGRFVSFHEISFENKEGLSTVYNRALEDKVADFNVFVHDDVWLNDYLLMEKISDASAYFDVIGVAGGKGWSPEGYDTAKHPVNWLMATRNAGSSGFVTHALSTKLNTKPHTMNYRNATLAASAYGETPSRTLTLDGCFLCLTRKAVEAGLRFDEQFKFHFYDMDLCFSAYLKNLRCGTAPVLLTHESIGLSVRQPEFMEAQKAFMAKWFGSATASASSAESAAPTSE